MTFKNPYSLSLLLRFFGDGVGRHQAGCVFVCDQFMKDMNNFHETARNSKPPTA